MTEIGDRVGPYVLEGVIGRGGMGVVYRARDPSGRPVALKRLAVHDDDVALRLGREAQVRVTHPNVVRVLGSGLDARGEPYVVTELLEGASLDVRVKVPLATLVQRFAAAADGLAAIHAAGIIHRDVKPSNLFVTKSGEVKLLDFGVASFASSSTVLTSTGALIGTPAFLSPEQARGDDVDARADLWSLGMSLYYALTQDLPFRRSSGVATALAVQNDPLPDLLERARMPISLELATLVERCLAKRAADRPASAEELARALRAVPIEAPLRPSQPLLPRPSETFRPVAILLVEGKIATGVVVSEAQRASGEAFRILGKTTAVVLGLASARGDELDRAVAMALRLSSKGALVVVGTARARSSGRELEPTSLEASTELFARLRGADPGTWVTASVATLVHASVQLELHQDGTARAVSLSSPHREQALLGRDAERAAIARAARTAARGAFTRVTITGESGIGKTELVRAALADVSRVWPDAVFRIGASRHGETAPFAPLASALDVVDDGGAEAATVAIDRRRARVIDAIGSSLVEVPLAVLVVEDAHDADDATLRLLDALEHDFADRPLLLIETRRHARVEAPPAQPTDVSLALGPLDAASIETLALALLGPVLARRIAEALTLRAGGNPRFADQLTRLALARGQGADVERWELPSTVESAIQARLDALPQALRSATHTMSVLGVEGTMDEARWALGASSDAWLRELAALDVLELSTRGTRLSWQFRSRVVREVAYEALAPSTARRLHDAFARRLANTGSASPEIVLGHAERAGDEALVLEYVRLALARAARIGDGHRVLDLLARVREMGGAATEELFLAAEAAAFVGRADPEALLSEALAQAENADARARALAELGERARRAGRVTNARALLERALAEKPSRKLAVRAACRLALVHVSEGEVREAARLLDSLSLEGTPVDARALFWDTRGYVEGARGALGGRREVYEQAAAHYAELGDARREAGARANLGDTLRELGELSLAERALRQAIEGARRVGNGLTEAYALLNLGTTLLTAGRRREAVLTLELARARASAVGDPRLACLVALRCALAEARAPTAADLAPLEQLDAGGADPMLRGLALTAQLTHGTPDAAALDAAEALLAQGEEIEQGAIELAAALHARRPSADVRARVAARVERSLRTIDSIEGRQRYLAHVRAEAPGLLD